MFDVNSSIHKFLDEPEQNALLRLTKMVEHLFHVPVAYVALLGADLAVVTRMGSGSEHWDNLKTFPLVSAFTARMPSDPSGISFPGFCPGKIQFAATAPLRSSDGLDLGLLVIADIQPHPEFSSADYEALIELGATLARQMELRAMAYQARENELSLREAERRFRNIANAAPVMIIYSCTDGASSFVNKAWLDFTGRTFAEEIGDGFEDMFHPDYREAVMQVYWKSFEARTHLTVEFPMRRHDGEYRWMLVNGVPRFQDDGVFAGYIGCFVDITDQRSTLLELQVQTRCTSAVAEALGAVYLMLDGEGRIRTTSALCGRESMHGQFIWEGCDGAIPAREAMEQAIKRIRSGSASLQVGTGDQVWNFTPIRSEKNELLAIAATVIKTPVARKSCGSGRCPDAGPCEHPVDRFRN